MNRFVVCVFVAGMALTNGQSFQCPNDKSGQYKHPTQCDKYYSCFDGVATELLCPDGLVFDETIRLKNKCDQPFNVDCGDRTELQPARSLNEKCPRKNGFFAHPDASICNVYYNCIDGEAIENKCTPALHFDEYSGNCVWPDTANRQGCKSAEELNTDSDEFRCPTQSIKVPDATGQIVAHPKYAHPTDCQKFYVCLSGVEKRPLGCPTGLVFNEISGQCDAPDNVEGCEHWYADETEEDVKSVKKARK